jgi:hypothetical protein
MSASSAASRLSQLAVLTTIAIHTFSAANAQIPEGITQWSTQIQAGPVSIAMQAGTMVMRIPIRSKPGAIPYVYELFDAQHRRLCQ